MDECTVIFYEKCRRRKVCSTRRTNEFLNFFLLSNEVIFQHKHFLDLILSQQNFVRQKIVFFSLDSLNQIEFGWMAL